MLNCKEATELVLKKEERRIGLKNQFNLWVHLMMCSLCKLFAKQSKQLSILGSKLQESNHSLSSDEKKEIIHTIETATL